LVIFSHLNWVQDDLGGLLTIDEQPLDVIGHFENQFTKLTRDCISVQRLSITDPSYKLTQSLIAEYSPPDSRLSTIAAVWHMDDWLLAEVEFKELLPAVVLIQRNGLDATIVPDAVWSGYSHPHLPAPFIRRFLIQKLDAPPLDLINCFEPQSQSFK
jgi:hypothetical protein